MQEGRQPKERVVRFEDLGDQASRALVVTSMSLSKSKYLANIVVAQLNDLITVVGSLVVTPAVVHALGGPGYGGWLLINSFIGYMRALDLGATTGTVKYAAGAYERGDKDDLSSIMNTSAAIFTAVGAAAGVGILALVAILPRLYPSIVADQTNVIVMMGAAVAIELLFRPFVATLRMRSLYYVYDAIAIGTYLVFKFGIVLYWALSGSLSYQTLGAVTLTETVVRLVLVLIAAMVVSPEARHINPLRARRTMVRKIAGIGIAVSIMTAADLVLFQLDAGVIGFFMPESPTSIAIFGLGNKIVSIAVSLVAVIGSVLVPRFSGFSETGNQGGTTKALEEASRFTGLACSFLLVNMIVLGPHFIELWLRTPWAAASGTILQVLIPGYWLSLLCTPSKALLLGHGKLWGWTIFLVVEAVANLALSIILIHPLGVLGVALGTAIPLAFFHGVLFPILLRREVGIPPATYWRMHLPTLGLGALYFLLIGGLWFVRVETFLHFGLLCAMTTILYIGLAFAFFPAFRAALEQRFAGLRRARAGRSESAL